MIVGAELHKDTLDLRLASVVVYAKPVPVSGRATRDPSKVEVGVVGHKLGFPNDAKEHRPLVTRATVEESPLVVDVLGDSDSEITRELDLGNTFNSGVQVLGCAMSVDVNKVVRWFNGVLSGAGLDEVIYSRD